jgi:TetR/AcrR family transcriptional repressor of nem operon
MLYYLLSKAILKRMTGIIVMAWKRNHKEHTRQRIVDAAAAAFRTHGISGIGVADTMRRAGLTHGGFYSHFQSKDDLAADAIAEVNAQRMTLFEKMVTDASSRRPLDAVINGYLSSRHREHPESGCFIACLGSELAREQGPARAQMSKSVASWLSLFSRHAPAADAPSKRRQATGMFAAMIGGMIMSRVVEDPHEADQILADVRRFLVEALAGSDDPHAGSR